MKQTHLSFGGRAAIRPHARRRDPLLWVRSISVLRELLPGDEHVVRRIALHRGLNVLWAKPAKRDAKVELFTGTTSGHDAGKTTFCRFIRHVLGEPTFGTKEFRDALRFRLPRGWIVGEVTLDGVDWVVGRPIGIGAHPFATRSGNAESALGTGSRGAFSEYEEALRLSVSRDLPVKTLPQSQTAFDWLHLLPWLARDQEARFASLLGWRDSTSESGVPETTADDRHAVARATLGLLSSDEAAAQNRAAVLNGQIEALRSDLPVLRARRDTELGRLAAQLNEDAAALGSFIEAAARKQLDDLKRAAEAEPRDDDGELAEVLATASTAVAAASLRVNQVEERKENQRTLVSQLEGGIVNALFARAGTVGDRCYVPMSIAVEHGCPLAKDRPVQLAEVRAKRDAAADLAQMKEDLKTLDGQVAMARRELVEAQRQHRVVIDRLREDRRAEREADARRVRLDEQAHRLRQQLGFFSDAQTRVERAEEALALAERDLAHSRDEQRQLRELNAPHLGHISDIYDFVIKALLGQGASGRLSEQGRELRLAVTQRGTVRGAALSTIKFLAFDLAALIARIEGHGAFPGLLIHDGPREADMDEALYRRLFLLAQLIEEAFKGEPGFQYIVTTTASPPSDVVKGHWLLKPILDATTPAGRFLGMDI